MPNGASVDQLYIDIQAKATKANDSIDKLVGKLDRLSISLSKINGNNLTGLANGVQKLGNAMQVMNQVKTADFTRLANNLQKMGNIDVAKLNSVASSMSHLTRAFNNLGNISNNAQKLGELAKGIAQLGYKSSTKALDNIPKLAVAMKQLMVTLSTAPKVSKNLIDMTNALAKLARTGSSSGKAVTSLSKALNIFSKSSDVSRKKSLSLASAIGKLYATYWMLFRVFGKIKEAINLSSALTEVQNVVDVTFGKYASLIEKMSETSIENFGMSELTVKQVASRFQAMGTAMGFTQGKMADMSVELTKLTADMASFYNMEQSAVAEDLESVFTGQTRPLRTYGLDLTEATLKEWAMKQGLDANIDSMSQMEKTMLRYQYVMASTGAAQGDFARTANTWANQTRILKQNLEQLGIVVGGTFINALKPLVRALNVVIGKFTEFSTAVSNSLGKIFGWTFESGGGVTSELEEGVDSADGIASGLGNAANSAKKLKQQLQGFDELNVLSSNNDNGSSGGGSAGVGSGAGETSNGQWVRTESMLEGYESELDSLYKLGDYISDRITKTLENIDWNKVYQGARNFGTGLANFLNGLLTPELFGSVGKTLANYMNTAVEAVLAFGETFNFEQFGEAIIARVKGVFINFDYSKLAKTVIVWGQGFVDLIVGAIKGAFGIVDFESTFSVVGEALDFLKEKFKGVEKIVPIVADVFKNLWNKVLVPLGKFIGDVFTPIVEIVSDIFEYFWKYVLNPLSDAIIVVVVKAFEGIADILNNAVFPSIENTIDIFSFLWKNVFEPIVNYITGTFRPVFETAFRNINTIINTARGTFEGLIDFVTGVFTGDWSKAWNGIKTTFTSIFDGVKTSATTIMTGLWSSLKNVINSIISGIEKMANAIVNGINTMIRALNKLSFKIPNWVPSLGGKSFGLNLKTVQTISIPRVYATGGFPEDGWFRANHGEIMGRFDNGQSVVANNKQITAGIAAAVYEGNKENNALIRQELSLLQRQNELLLGILEKETGISASDIFRSVRKSADEYMRTTGEPAFSY